MIAILAPAKTMDTTSGNKTRLFSVPEFLNEADQLVSHLKKYSPPQLASLMKISLSLAELNNKRFLQWSVPFSPATARHAVMAYRGDVYEGLDADSFTENDLRFAQRQLRILSGLYGLLRPLDLVQAYRLEMALKFSFDGKTDLYDFWGDKLASSLTTELSTHRDNTLINLASNEYFKAIDNQALRVSVITPVFKDFHNGKYPIISVYAKKARGAMASFIVRNRLEDPDQLKTFDRDGYYYNDRMSNNHTWVFTRG